MELKNESKYRMKSTGSTIEYKAHVKVWEIWNEPNSGAFWQTQGKNFMPPVADYGRIVR